MSCIMKYLLFLIFVNTSENKNPQNVLMILVDDLRAEIGPYLDTDDAFYPKIQTPNINSLAEESIVFNKAYTQFPICGPSRNSFMTGRRPDTTKVYLNGQNWREEAGQFNSIPQYFKENGYVCYGAGKIYHGFGDNYYSWSESKFYSTTGQYWHKDGLSWKIAYPEDYNNISLPDMEINEYVIEKLQEVADNQQPFFIAAGYTKPHLPLIAPKMHFDLYPEGDMYLANNKYVPLNHPPIAWSYWNDLPAYNDTADFDRSFNSTLPDYKALELRRAYYASVSFVDSLVGDLLNELKRLNLSDNTIILLLSDHGWQLGEHGEWAKNTNFELDLRIPLILKVPGLTNGGRVTNALVELVDIFPSLVDLVGLPSLLYCPEESSEIKACHEGHSFVELITEPYREWKSAIFSQLIYSDKVGDPMGYTVGTHGHRYVRWMEHVNGNLIWSNAVAEELFDLQADPNQLENVADYPAFSDVKAQMSELLYLGWRNALPKEDS